MSDPTDETTEEETDDERADSPAADGPPEIACTLTSEQMDRRRDWME